LVQTLRVEQVKQLFVPQFSQTCVAADAYVEIGQSGAATQLELEVIKNDS
jgi:hypothetical protein